MRRVEDGSQAFSVPVNLRSEDLQCVERAAFRGYTWGKKKLDERRLRRRGKQTRHARTSHQRTMSSWTMLSPSKNLLNSTIGYPGS